MLGITAANKTRATIVRVLAVLFAAFGVWASFDRDMFAKLFQGFSFDYCDENRPAILFFAAMLSIMAVYVFVTYYALKIAEREPPPNPDKGEVPPRQKRKEQKSV